MNINTLPRNRVQTFLAPGLYVPVRHVAGIEVLPPVHRLAVTVDKTTIRGTAAELFALGRQIMRAAVAVDPSLIESHTRPTLRAA
jgi:hypothetical protein